MEGAILSWFQAHPGKCNTKQTALSLSLHLENSGPRKGVAVELHYFAELNLTKIAKLLGVSSSTVKYDLHCAWALLEAELRS